MGRKPKLTPAVRRQIIRDFRRSGIIKIAGELNGVSGTTARAVLIEEGIHTPHQRKEVTLEDIRYLQYLRLEQGFSLRTIKRITGRSNLTVKKYCSPPWT